MTEESSPQKEKRIVSNELLDDLWSKHQYEMMRFPMHLTDEMCVKQVRQCADQNILYAVAMMRGIIPIVTVGGSKSFIADFSKKEKSKRSLPKYLNPSYNSTEQVEKHLRDQRDSV